MEYIVADINKAKEWGFSEMGHTISGNVICLNEKEVMNNLAMDGSIAERAELLGGSVVSATTAKMILNNNK